MPSPSLRCPHDGSVLSSGTLEGVEVDRCGRCGGLWFDRTELAEATQDAGLEAYASAVASFAPRSAFDCPRCGGACFQSPVGSVVVDSCSNCSGVWIESGEMAPLRRATRDEASRREFGTVK